MSIYKIIKTLIPEPIKYQIKYFCKYKKILNYLKEKPEYSNEYNYLKNNKISVFPYKFVKNYDWKNIKIQRDENGRYFYLFNNKKMYFKKSMTEKNIKKYVNSILMEQDEKSPHNYHLDIIKNDKRIKVIADIGAAEGFLSLELIDNVDKIYLFECDDEWIEALNKTFKNFKDKVEIVKKYVSNINNEDNITLDTFFENKKIDFIKADIEGAELSMLIGGVQTFKKIQRAVICTYHRQDDAESIKSFLIKGKFKVGFSDGYMLFIYDKTLSEPYLRRGVILAENILRSYSCESSCNRC